MNDVRFTKGDYVKNEHGVHYMKYTMVNLNDIALEFKREFVGFNILTDEMKKRLFRKVAQFWHLEKNQIDKENKEGETQVSLNEIGSYTDDYNWSKHNFNTGDCDIYAVSLHRLYNYPLYAIRGKFLEPEWGGEREWDYEYCHIMVKLPNGKFLDSQGESTEAEMKENSFFSEDVKKVEIIPITENDALSIFSCEDQEPVINQVINFIQNKNEK